MDLLVFSHLRWDFVYQRPQHLISRFAKDNRVWFFEEPLFGDEGRLLRTSAREDQLTICVPHLPHGLSEQEIWDSQRDLLTELVVSNGIHEYACWYYNPMAVNFTRQLTPAATVYDCMDELSGFRGAPPGLCQAEQELFRRADLVFTGGQSLYESKRTQHSSVHAFPSSIDASHCQHARTPQDHPEDRGQLPHPRIGIAGVIDERLDIDLLRNAAELRPEWHFVMIGPVVKISHDDLPKTANIHYLGGKDYRDLPHYMAGWDIGMLPFARNEATKFISPTKTPEYLAAGLPVISTSIRDVVRPYGERKLAEIADDAEAFIAACEGLLQVKHDTSRKAQTDAFLSGNSWDMTWSKMNELLVNAILVKRRAQSGESANVSMQEIA